VLQLDLSDNRISDSLEALVGCSELEHVSLSGNPIKELTSLEPLVCHAACHLTDVVIFDEDNCCLMLTCIDAFVAPVNLV